MKKHRARGGLKAEELERRLAPGRLGYIEPPESTPPGGGGSSSVGDPDDPIRRRPGKSDPKAPRLFHRD